jgi:hypothetical protein
MSVFGINAGVPGTTRAVLANGNATTVLDATNKSGLRVVGILLTNHSGGAVTPIVDVYDGSTAFIVRDNASLSDTASTSVTLPGFIHLHRDDVLRVTAAANVTVIVSYVDITASGAQR